MITLRPYQPQLDEPAVLKLWHDTLGLTWPISQDTFHFITVANVAYHAGDHLVALADNTIIGFAGYQISDNTPQQGSLLVILVAPAYQRQGIGRQLHNAALTKLQERGVTHIHLGSGALFNFWAGIPCNLPTSWSFFQACGWSERERTFDLIGELNTYTTPSWIIDRLNQTHSTVEIATTNDIAAILSFQAQHFPYWLTYYQNIATPSTINTVIIARDAEGSIIGTSFLRLPPHLGGTQDIPWTLTLGENTGGIGPLGVAETARGRGIGLALAAKVTELLQAKGITTSYIGYTWLTNWYSHLGYSIWAEYRLCTKPL